MDYDLRALGPGNLSGGFDSLPLRWMMRRIAAVALAADGPLGAAFDYMLICHGSLVLACAREGTSFFRPWAGQSLRALRAPGVSSAPVAWSRNLHADLRRAEERAFRHYERAAELLPALHRTASRCSRRGEHEMAQRLYDWMGVPYTLWPVDIAGMAEHFVARIKATGGIDENFRFLVDLLGAPPNQQTRDEIEAFEHHVRKGAYDHLIKCPEKFDALEQVLAYDVRLREAWMRLKRTFRTAKYAKNGVIRRRMSEERNFRAGWDFRWETARERFLLLFDALCYRWQLYGMEYDKPLLLKLSVNPTPHGTLIMVPRLLSLDGDRDLRWKEIGRLHRAHGARRQGRKASVIRAAMYKEAAEIAKHEAAGRTLGYVGNRLTAYILDKMGKHPATDESWIKRRQKLLRGFSR